MCAIGDSLTAGMQDACLDARSAHMSYTAQLARQAGIPYHQPEVNKHGIPPRLFIGNEVDIPRTLFEYATLALVTASPLFFTHLLGRVPGAMLHPIYDAPGMGHRTKESRDSEKNPQHNFAIPGYELRHFADVGHVSDYLHEIHNHVSRDGFMPVLTPLIHSIIQNGKDKRLGSELDQVVKRNPDLVVLWGGNNDALEPITGGVVDDVKLTPMDDKKWSYWDKNPLTGKWHLNQTKTVQKGFRRSFNELIERLEKDTKAEVLVCTVPDVSVIPFLKKVGEPLGPLPFRVKLPNGEDVTPMIEKLRIPDGVKGAGKNGRTSYPAGTLVGITTVLKKIVSILGSEPKNSGDLQAALNAMNEPAVFEENDVLDPDEIGQIRGRLGEYNDLIRQTAATHPRVHLVDTHELLQQAQAGGIPLVGTGDPVTVNNSYTGLGGFFSFDGIHPSDVGYSVVSNALLRTIQSELVPKDDRFKFFANVTPVDERAVYRQDPHVTGRDEASFVLCKPAVELLNTP
jgi:hypothetical protein